MRLIFAIATWTWMLFVSKAVTSLKVCKSNYLKKFHRKKSGREKPSFDVKTLASKSRSCSQATRLILIFLALRHESKYG